MLSQNAIFTPKTNTQFTKAIDQIKSNKARTLTKLKMQ